MLRGKVLVAQGGGPTAVINESMVGAVIESRKVPSVERVYGAYHGVSGILKEDFIDLTRETTHNLEMVGNTPCSALGSTREKPDEKYCAEIFKVRTTSTAPRSSRSCRLMRSGPSSTLAATTPPTRCASSMSRPGARTIR